MSNSPGRQKRIPLRTCPACGSSWFCKSSPERYSCTGEQISKVHVELLVCLCGTPLEPEFGGVAPSATVARELDALEGSFQAAAAAIAAGHDSSAVAQLAEAELMQKAALEKAAEEASRIERAIGRALAREKKAPRGRHWRMPVRKPSAGMRDQMAWALQEKSFTFRESRQIVRCVLDAMGKALLAGEEVETPFGILTQTEAPPRQERRNGFQKGRIRPPASARSA